jgi:hypothetical protein
MCQAKLAIMMLRVNLKGRGHFQGDEKAIFTNKRIELREFGLAYPLK